MGDLLFSFGYDVYTFMAYRRFTVQPRIETKTPGRLTAEGG
jgi:hypothetical protein